MLQGRFWSLLFVSVATATAVSIFWHLLKPSDSKEQSGSVRDYDLRIDEQAERFLTMKHQLTYFLVTASIVPIGFTAGILQQRQASLRVDGPWFLLIMGGAVGLVAAGLALFSLLCDIESHRLHVKYRYERKTLQDLPDHQRKNWTKLNKMATWLRKMAVFFLTAEVPLISAFLVVTFTS